MDTQLSSPIQDKNGNFTFILNASEITTRDKDVCFSLEGKTYTLNVNLKVEREQIKKEINTNSLAKYKWFKEETGLNHWVLYNTKMYEVKETFDHSRYLHYREGSSLAPVIPVNASSCHAMFRDCSNLTQIDLSNFDTSQVTDMCFMFYNCERLKEIDLNNFNTSNVTDMSSMFEYCKALAKLDLSNFNTSRVVNMCNMFSGCSNLTTLNLSSFNTNNVITMAYMFFDCKALTSIYTSDEWNINNVHSTGTTFTGCCSLPSFSPEKTDIKMAKSIEEGGYLTLKK